MGGVQLVAGHRHPPDVVQGHRPVALCLRVARVGLRQPPQDRLHPGVGVVGGVQLVAGHRHLPDVVQGRRPVPLCLRVARVGLRQPPRDLQTRLGKYPPFRQGQVADAVLDLGGR